MHGMGFAKAFGLARLDALHEPISRPLGLDWLLAEMLLLASTALLRLLDVACRGKRLAPSGSR